MSRTRRGSKPIGLDWWGKRPFSGHHGTDSDTSDKFWKKQTSKIERQDSKKEIDRQVNE